MIRALSVAHFSSPYVDNLDRRDPSSQSPPRLSTGVTVVCLRALAYNGQGRAPSHQKLSYLKCPISFFTICAPLRSTEALDYHLRPGGGEIQRISFGLPVKPMAATS